jgi:hypothetical protein
MSFVTTYILMILLTGDNRATSVEEIYMLALSVFSGYLISMLFYLTWRKI